MRLSDSIIDHGEGDGEYLYLIGVGSSLAEGARGGILRHYIIFADSPEDALERFKKNLTIFAAALKNKFAANPESYYYNSDKPNKMLEDIEKGCVEVELVDKDRAIPVSYFDDTRNNY